MKSSPLLRAGAQCVCVEQTTNRSRFKPTFFSSRAATSSVTFEPTAQLSTATRTLGPPPPASPSPPIANARALSRLATPSDSVLRNS